MRLDLTDFGSAPVNDKAAEMMVICAGCGCSICLGQKMRSIYLAKIDKLFMLHDKKRCLLDWLPKMKNSEAKLEALVIVRWLVTAEQREKAHLS